MAKQTSDRIYTITRRIGQLMDTLGSLEIRTFGILSSDIIFRMKKRDWDDLYDYATTIASPLTLLDKEVLFTSQELSPQGENSLTCPESF